MHFEYSLSAAHVGKIDVYLPVEPTGTHERGVENVRAVGRRHDDYMLVGIEAVHCDEKLVERLLALVVTAAETRAALSAYSVYLVDKDDTGLILFRLVEEVANARRTDADEHLDEVRAGLGEERHVRLARYGFGEKRFTSSGRTDEQYAVRHSRADRGELAGVFEELDYLFEFFFLFLRARHVAELDFGLTLRIGLGLAEVHGLLGRRAHRAEHKYGQHDQKHQPEHGDYIIGYARRITVVELDDNGLIGIFGVVRIDKIDEPVAHVHAVIIGFTAVVADVRGVVLYIHLRDVARLDILLQVRVRLFVHAPADGIYDDTNHARDEHERQYEYQYLCSILQYILRTDLLDTPCRRV